MLAARSRLWFEVATAGCVAKLGGPTFRLSNNGYVAVAFASWCLFMYFTLWPLTKWGPFSAATRAKLRFWLLVFLVFMTSSWIAFAQLR